MLVIYEKEQSNFYFIFLLFKFYLDTFKYENVLFIKICCKFYFSLFLESSNMKL